MSLDGKFGDLIQVKRAFLQTSVKDYAAGGNDMLDDVKASLDEAKTEILNHILLASYIREESGDVAYRNECLEMFNSWFEKWFGKP
ncbi:MAG: hypothetical protein LBC12_06035 [Nitrososphaerota archaeon]|jgi:hypothetical protein|nr:hypothetical protein [Nitrososphaerota archaeon]